MLTRTQFVSSTARTSPGVNGRRYITIHETANTSRGADAQAHANLQSSGNVRSASWHWQVDDKQAIQSYPHTARCWHAGDGGGPGNMSSIGIEICVNSDGDYKRAVANAVALTRQIMAAERIPASRVVQHNHWSGKNCPTFLRSGSRGPTWAGFRAALTKEVIMTDVELDLTQRIALSEGGRVSTALNGLTSISVGGALSYSGAGGWQALIRLPRVEARLAAIETAVKADRGIDADTLALDVAAALAPLIVSEVVAGVGSDVGLTSEQVEAAAERAMRSVLGSLAVED